MYQAINENYGLFKDDFEHFMDKSGILSVEDYNIYSMDGELLYPNGEGHAMIAIDEIDNKHCIVSTWGEKLICELKYPRTLERN